MKLMLKTLNRHPMSHFDDLDEVRKNEGNLANYHLIEIKQALGIGLGSEVIDAYTEKNSVGNERDTKKSIETLYAAITKALGNPADAEVVPRLTLLKI